MVDGVVEQAEEVFGSIGATDGGREAESGLTTAASLGFRRSFPSSTLAATVASSTAGAPGRQPGKNGGAGRASG